jgi:hypothetical protein
MRMTKRQVADIKAKIRRIQREVQLANMGGSNLPDRIDTIGAVAETMMMVVEEYEGALVEMEAVS